jgi:hypothetical protein
MKGKPNKPKAREIAESHIDTIRLLRTINEYQSAFCDECSYEANERRTELILLVHKLDELTSALRDTKEFWRSVKNKK